MTTRLRSDDGVTAIEFVTVMPLVILVGALMWEFLIAGAAATAVENAARDGSRVAGQGASSDQVAAQVVASLPGWLSAGDVRVSRPGDTEVVVTVPIPLVLPGLDLGGLSITRRAELPDTT